MTERGYHSEYLYPSPPVLEFSVCGVCLRCTHPVGYWGGRLLDTDWEEAECYPHDDPDKTHIVRDIIIRDAIDAGATRPEAVWNSIAALVRSERVPIGLRGSHVKSAARALAGGRADW